MKVTCLTCSKEEDVWQSRAKTYKCCSRECFSIYRKLQNPNKVKCTECGTIHYKKPSASKRYRRTHGTFCSATCYAVWKSKNTFGINNPNFRNRMYDEGGYRIVHSAKYGAKKLHHVVVFELLGIDKLPEGMVVHHRDCNHLNNHPLNLALVSGSDHRWLHAQYGSAVLWAFFNNKISSTELAQWSNNPGKSLILLNSNILIEKSLLDFKKGLLKLPTILPEWADELSETSRGTGGFGSTGLK